MAGVGETTPACLRRSFAPASPRPLCRHLSLFQPTKTGSWGFELNTTTGSAREDKGKDTDEMGDADRLPMANVSRIVQGALPKDAAIAKEARVALSACATVFVHYVTEL